MHSNKFRLLGLQLLDKDVSVIPSEIYNASNVRTFVSFCPLDYEIQGNGAWAKKIFNVSLLRVLNLSHTGVEELPQSISKLKHLRYLDISHTGIHTFPASFRQLYNLQTLILTGYLRGFISLTYLAIEGCESLKSLPDGIQYLPALQTLIIGGFSEHLISFPFPAATGSDGERYFISLRELKICGWPTLLDDVLPDQLQLLTSLELLSIKDFPCLLGLPEWFGELSSLQTLDIECCSRLKYLPSEEQMLRLTSLEILNIRDCPLLLKRCCRCCGKEEWHKVARLKQVGRSSPLVDDEITRDAAMNEELLERRSSGRYCFMLFPRSLYIEWGQDRRYWRWLSKIESSASGDGEIEVPSLIQVSWLHVEGKVDMSNLNPGVNYEVVFVVMMFEEWSCGWGTPVNLWLVLPNGQKLVQKVSLETMPKSKWIEIHVGDFETPQQPGDEERIVHFMMFEHVDQLWKRGFVIEGAIVRPKK
ncbi:hypothetical protein C5167_030207 [Papaver somniferum]|nr:hypothetical protein C5167_030207 [Papaver somniferum]